MAANETGEGDILLTAEGRSAWSVCVAVAGWLAMLVFAFHACTHMVAAGDTWVAMACGRHFVNHGVDTVEPFSANSHRAGPTEAEVATWPGWARWITEKVGLETVRKWHPTGWINQNWLTHVIFYRLTTLFGSEQEPYFDALVFWKFAVYFLAVAAIYVTARLLGVDPALAAAASGFALFVGRSFFDIRPAGFSNLLVAVFILILALTSYRNALYIWLIVPVVVFWSNVHGGYIYAFIVLVPFMGWHIILHLPKRWLVAVYSILTWLVLYGLTHQFLGRRAELVAEYFSQSNAGAVGIGDWMIVLLVLAIGGSIAAVSHRQIGDRALTALHGVATCVVFLLVLVRYFPAPPNTMNERILKIFADHAAGGRWTCVGMFVLSMAFGAAVLAVREKGIRVLDRRTLLHTLGAGAVAFVAMVVFNPFHLTNLTHTFVISVSKHAERWRDVHEWHRALDWTNPVGTAIPFLTMYIFAWLALLVWAVLSVRMALAEQYPKKRGGKAEAPAEASIDVVFIIVAALTVYMALRSRRFIPIAAFAACPVIALLVQRIVAAILTLADLRGAARLPDPARDELVERLLLLGLAGALAVLGLWRLLFWRWLFFPVPGAPTQIQPRFWLLAFGTLLAFSSFPLVTVFCGTDKSAGGTRQAGALAFLKRAWQVAALMVLASVMGFGLWVGLRFKLIYLDYWPADPKLTSVFMRMTASDAKPFYACQFIRENKLSGNMFNYWTEGGFIAWGQDPDPNTGRTPLQLFMDGRAQAAYDTRTFDLWTEILAGGPAARRAAYEGRDPTAAELREIGQWVTEQLNKFDVWVVLMPANQFDKDFVRALEYDPNWRLVFLNNKQKLFVNVTTERGKELFGGMFTGRTTYPDEFTANFSVGHNLLLSAEASQRQQGLDMVIKAFHLDPSPGPMLDLLVIAARYPELQQRVNEICVEYTTQFEKNKSSYANHDGYNLRLEAARLAMVRLKQVAEAQGNRQVAQTCENQMKRYLIERDLISDRKRW
ncbi:MAG TPA: hypothetical protein PLU87_00280 [Sedimentisphaerales bacterium]|nr:hypothetical protein [Sedimentisphaerales bacterium]HRS09689.1 hypothetical protein [Sedimentisphaerales bacterium]HRV46370.1 hypothetical protein [Sedimentisphaerales bacterium]